MKHSKDNKIREKVDGFTLDNNGDSGLRNSFVTTDQGVYSPPDDNYETRNKEND